MTKRKILGDHPSEARAKHMSARDSGGVENRRRVVGHRGCRIRARRAIASADAAIVEGDDLELTSE